MASSPIRRRPRSPRSTLSGNPSTPSEVRSLFIEFWLYDHPSTEHRAEFAEHYDPWANEGHGKFFESLGVGNQVL